MQKYLSKKVTISQASILALVLAIIFYSAGFVVADKRSSGEHEHIDSTATASTQHQSLNVSGSNTPTISNLKVIEDSKSGWNISFDTNNFTFTPQNAGNNHIDNQGHAHLYIDGKKLTRLYSNNYYLSDLTEGEHTIRVTLNTNDHRDYSVNGTVISSEVKINDHHHESEVDGHSH